MSTRRAPRWLVRTTATALAVTLAGGLTAAAGLEPPPGRLSLATTPAGLDGPLTVPTPTPSPTRAVAPARPVVCEHPRPYRECLGPPPGPQADTRPARVAAPQDRYAFLVGVTDYRRPTVDTIGGANDVRYLRQLLLDSGWLPQNVRVVTDREATGAAVRDGMRWLVDKGRPGTFTLFHFSGHVKQFGGRNEALWTVDRDWVRDREVTRVLSQVRGRLWVDVAGCEAGSFLPGLPSERVLVTASSRDVEKSYEYPEWSMSVWSGTVLRLGIREGQADADRDGRVTIGEALRYGTYYSQVITWSQEPYGRQTPQVQGDPVRGWTLAEPPA